MRRAVVGWDVGGVHTKVALVGAGRVLAAYQRPFEVQHAPQALVSVLRELASRLDAPAGAPCAVTMTAEISQMFRTKREGVGFVIDAFDTAFPGAPIHVFTVDGLFVHPAQARLEPLSVAASNWAATAHEVARQHRDALLVDMGTTTTDIIPIAGGQVVARGSTDPERLASGELVYTGAVRTPAEAIASAVPFAGGTAGVSAEGFAIAGDVYVWRGELAPEDYSAPTPDGRPATREFAGERLARLVCADRDLLDERAVSSIADALARAQRARVAASVARVARRHPSVRNAVVTGIGSFVALEACRDAGLWPEALPATIGNAPSQCAPAASVALLLYRHLHDAAPVPAAGWGGRRSQGRVAAPASACGSTASLPVLDDALRHMRPSEPIVSAVVKVGGGMLAHPRCLEDTLAAIEACAGASMLVVPGGGPFADVVRDADRRFRPGDSAAHWMAVLAMDQYAHLLAARLEHGALVADVDEVVSAVQAGRIPVLAPYRWLRAADPLPHTWDVTSDSIAAWLARTIGARRLLLVKPPGVTGAGAADPYFARAIGPDLAVTIVAADGDLRRQFATAIAETPARARPGS